MTGIERETRDNILMGIVGVVFFLNVLILNGLLIEISPSSDVLFILGWVILGIGALLVALSLLTLRKKGTANLVSTGVYGIVRHPMYVGGLVMFISHPFFGQDWIMVITSAIGVYCCYLLVLSEDQQLIERFGQGYLEYMKRVPGVNFIKGFMQSVKR